LTCGFAEGVRIGRQFGQRHLGLRGLAIAEKRKRQLRADLLRRDVVDHVGRAFDLLTIDLRDDVAHVNAGLVGGLPA
jgi:hypothetical protein